MGQGYGAAVRRGTAESSLTGFEHPLAMFAANDGLLVGDWGPGIVYRNA